jgi:hypothetical protein
MIATASLMNTAGMGVPSPSSTASEPLFLESFQPIKDGKMREDYYEVRLE